MKITLTIDETEIKKAIELWLEEKGLTKVLTVKVLSGNTYSSPTTIEVTLAEEGLLTKLKEGKGNAVNRKVNLDVS